MVTVDEFSRVVAEVYASSTSPENWMEALASIGRILDATGCAVFTGEGTSRSVLAATVPSEARDSYIAYYHMFDYVLDAVEKGPAGLIRGGQELVALKTHPEFEGDFMRPFQMNDGLFVRLTAGTLPTSSFLVAAPKGFEPFDTADRVKFMGALVPHLQQALRTQSHLAEIGNRAHDSTEIIDAIRHGIVIVETGLRVVQMNSAAEHILAARDGLCVRLGRMEATRASTNEQLRRSVARACKGRNGPRSGDSLVGKRPSGKRSFVIHIVPVASSETPAARALVMIIDPEQGISPPKTLIRQLFGLTNAEADVALRVMRGDGLKPISEELTLSMATVKTHLQHIFEKTDTHRQAELVRHLVRLCP
jgi:DNA-binding CsgD family transcriptional regulator